MTILVLHGLNSTARGSRTCQTVKSHFGDVTCIDYPSSQPREVIAEYLDHLDIEWSQVDAVIGCSLGGYWARYLGRKLMVNTILINPSLKFYNDDDDDPKELPIMLIVCEDDDVVNPHYSINKYTDRARVIILKSGGHRCSTLSSCFPAIETMLNTFVWVSD